VIQSVGVLPLDLLVRTSEQLHERLAIGDGFIRDILERGKVLYEAEPSVWSWLPKRSAAENPSCIISERPSSCSRPRRIRPKPNTISTRPWRSPAASG